MYLQRKVSILTMKKISARMSSTFQEGWPKNLTSPAELKSVKLELNPSRIQPELSSNTTLEITWYCGWNTMLFHISFSIFPLVILYSLHIFFNNWFLALYITFLFITSFSVVFCSWRTSKPFPSPTFFPKYTISVSFSSWKTKITFWRYF